MLVVHVHFAYLLSTDKAMKYNRTCWRDDERNLLLTQLLLVLR